MIAALIVFFLSIFMLVLVLSHVNEMMAMRYCQYRLWKGEENDILSSFFRRELKNLNSFVLKRQQKNKIKWLARRWINLPVCERAKFMDLNQGFL